MKRLTLYAFVIAFALSWAALQVSAKWQTQSLNQKPTRKVQASTVSGRILVRGKGKSGIVVALRPETFGPQLTPALKATSDADGNYRINNVPPGTYVLVPVAAAYFIPESSVFGFRGKRLIVAEGESIDGIDFSITRGAVITGKILDPEGRPIIEERVNITREDQMEQGQMGPDLSGAFITDDRGIYRVFGLPPGRYRVSAGHMDQLFIGPTRGRVLYPRTYYPDASDPAAATIVDLTEGGEATDIDIRMRAAGASFAATGVVIDGETNKPVADARFGLQRIVDERNGPATTTGATSNRLGEFRVENLMPGKYAIFVMSLPNGDVRSEPVIFDIVDQNISGLVIRTLRAASVSGTIVVEGTSNKAVLARLPNLRIVATVQTENAGAPAGTFPQPSPVSADGSFRLTGLQTGVARFHLISQDPRGGSGFTITRIERDGVEVPGVEIRGSENVSGVKIIVVHGTGSIRGTVKFENGPAPAGTRFMVRITKTGSENSFFGRPQELDARGYFLMDGLPAGSYEVLVNGYALKSRGRPTVARQSVNVTEGTPTDVELVLDLNSSTAP